MKNLQVVSSFLIVLFFLSCSQNEPTSPGENDQQNGKLFLKIDKANAPESVVWVEAFLTRQGYDTLSDEMNILSDSTADLLLENIQAGEWHLRVNAKDSTEVALYTGETDIQIFAGFTTQVNLVLEPTGAGIGNIYILVTWGLPSANWTDFEGNPIFIPSGNYWDYSGVQQPKILIEENLIKMYYTSQGSAYSGYTGYAYSSDGINWTFSSNNPVLSPGPAGSWDATAVSGATIIKDEIGYKIYYSGWTDPSSPWHIGLATSEDGVNWVKYPIPVLYASGGWEYQIAPSSIIKVDSIYYLYYYGRNLSGYLKINLATSTDGINWTKYSGNPIMTYDQPWEGVGVCYPNVYEKNSQYEMIYSNQAGTGFGKAISTDAINWVKEESNPFFTKDQVHNNWASYKIAYPNFIRINNHDRIYYTGFNLNGSPYSIGFITK